MIIHLRTLLVMLLCLNIFKWHCFQPAPSEHTNLRVEVHVNPEPLNPELLNGQDEFCLT